MGLSCLYLPGTPRALSIGLVSLNSSSSVPNRMSGYTLFSRGENVSFNQSNRLNSLPSFQ